MPTNYYHKTGFFSELNLDINKIVNKKKEKKLELFCIICMHNPELYLFKSAIDK